MRSKLDEGRGFNQIEKLVNTWRIVRIMMENDTVDAKFVKAIADSLEEDFGGRSFSEPRRTRFN